MLQLDFATGVLGDEASRRTLKDLAHLFEHKPENLDTVVYRTYGGSPDSAEPDLAYATTVIEPGDVNGEYFMTRGHIHTNQLRGEWMLTLGGEGKLVLFEGGRSWTEDMRDGTVHMIQGSWAHRVVNTGPEQLKFIVVWLTDCGHDYNVQFPVRFIRPNAESALNAEGEPR